MRCSSHTMDNVHSIDPHTWGVTWSKDEQIRALAISTFHSGEIKAATLKASWDRNPEFTFHSGEI